MVKNCTLVIGKQNGNNKMKKNNKRTKRIRMRFLKKFWVEKDGICQEAFPQQDDMFHGVLQSIKK